MVLMYLHTSVPRQIQQIGITIPPKVTTTPIRDQRELEQEITHWKPKAMVMAERFTQDLGEGSTTITIVEEKFMFLNNSRVIFLVLGILISFNSKAFTFNDACAKVLQSKKIYENSKKLIKANEELHSKLVKENFSASDSDLAGLLGAYSISGYQALHYLQAMGTLLPLIKDDPEKNISLYLFGEKGTYKRKDLLKILEIGAETELRFINNNLKQISIYLPRINSSEIRVNILEIRALLEDTAVSLSACR